MRIITISREFGSGGRELGKRLADLLACDYYDSEIVHAVAQKSGMDAGYVADTVAALTELGVCPAGEDVHVQLRGGELIIRVLPGKKLLMTGSAVTVCEGVTEV